MRIEELLDDLYDFPRTFCAWIVFHLAEWLDMKVIPSNEDESSIEDEFYQLLEDIDIEDVDKKD